MKITKVLKISLLTAICLVVIGYIAYAMIGMSHASPEELCSSVELRLENSKSIKFVDEKGIESILKKADLYPKEKSMSQINTKKIEETLKSNEFIANVECFKAGNGKFCIRVVQRTPVIYILPDGRDGYFVDQYGKVISNTNYPKNMVAATGAITKEYACAKLSEFGLYIQEHEFWNNQIEQIYVRKNSHGEPIVELVPRVGDHVINLGSIDGYEKKLSRLKVFYDKATPTVGWNKYAKIDLQYDGQIVCTKHTN